MMLVMICLTLYHRFLLVLAELSFFYRCAHVCICLHRFCKVGFVLEMFSCPFKKFAKFVLSFLYVVL